MATSRDQVTIEFLQRFADAFNRHDADAVMALMTEDCVFDLAYGPAVHGERFVGREAVRQGFLRVWSTFPDGHWGEPRHFVAGNRGVTEWRFTGTRGDGERVEVNGCDIFTFRNGKIAVKDSFRKIRA